MVKSRLFWTWLFCAPAIIVIAMVAGWPLARTSYLAFTDASLSNLGSYEWVGLTNFKFLIEDPDWWQSVWNTFVFVFWSVSIETILGLFIALVLNSAFRGRGALRAAVLIPWAIPTVVSAKMWAWMFNDQYGVINEILVSLGLVSGRIAWLAEDSLALFTVVAVDVWKTTPFMALLILAGLQTIPKNIYEAARIDGIPPVKQFLTITLPLLMPSLLVAVIFRTLDALRIFDLPYVLTSNSKSVAVMSVYARQQLVDFQDFGYGSAVSFLIFVLIGTITLLIIATGRKHLGIRT